jgi:hypothetical protein
MFRTGVISIWFQAGGFPVPFPVHVGLLLLHVVIYAASVTPSLCGNAVFLSSSQKWREWVGYLGSCLEAVMYGAMGAPDGGAEIVANSTKPGSHQTGAVCLHVVAFLQFATAYVFPLFVHHCWEARSRYK